MKSKVNEEEYIEEYLKDIPDSKLGTMFGISDRTAERISSKLRSQGKVPNRKDLVLDLPTERLKQQNKDLSRVDRKTLREYLRVENSVIEYHKELIKVLNKHKLPKTTKKTKITISKGVGIFHLTDLHFNELVDLEFNKYDFNIAAKRLKKLVNRAKIYFKANKIRKVLIAMTGDLINSDRRLDELLSEATNRSNATFLAVSLLKQVILDLNQDYEISLVNVVGNESRVQENLGWTEILASDNYDNTIYNFLKYIFIDSDINFITGNSIEQVVEVNNQNVLFVHGNQFKSKLEQTTQKIKGKYSARDTKISFVISGHLHCLDENVEVLTKEKGFVKLKNMTTKETVYSYKKGYIVENKPKEVILGNYTGKWYKFHNRFTKQEMTEKHHVYSRNDEYMTIKDFIIEEDMNNLICSSNPLKKETKEIYSDDFLRLLIATCADGSYEHKSVRFHFKKTKKIFRLKKIVKKLGFELEWGVADKRGAIKTKRFPKELSKKLFIASPNKKLPFWLIDLNSRQRKIVVEEIRYWDGGFVGRNGCGINSYQFSSAKPVEIDIIQHLLLLEGVFGRRLPNRQSTITYNDRIEWKHGTKTCMFKPNISYIKNKKVGCLETNTHNFIIRTKEGNIEVTGNSCRLGETYARGGSLVGANGYSDSALQLESRASQNVHIFYGKESWDSIKIDLQNVDGVIGYPIQKELEAYNAKSVSKAKKKTIISKIAI